MGQKSTIEWTDASWTPIRARVKDNAAEIARDKGYASLVQILTAKKPDGTLRVPPGKAGPHCEHTSPGCDNCYSENNNGRCLPANGTGLPFDRRARDLVDLFVDEKILTQPLKWRAPRKIFVCSQTDLFGEFVTNEMIDRVFAVMALCPQHTFQVLTKRAARMREYLGPVDNDRYYANDSRPARIMAAMNVGAAGLRWPLPNVWLGVSVEDQQRADERVPHLLQTPAAVRFISAEPLLGPVNIQPWLPIKTDGRFHFSDCACLDCFRNRTTNRSDDGNTRWIDWVIVGGESGPGARPMDLAWARSIVQQCKAAGVACFVKQLGAKLREGNANGNCRNLDCTHPDCGYMRHRFTDKKGGDPSEWPEDLRVREMPIPAIPAAQNISGLK